ncbi:MAG: VOC family protein [Ignavibacterium sp.]|nr:VOC family protein [Ignavibacterium sp.]
MKIDHVAIWTKDLERLREFYTKYFNIKSNSRYTNTNRGFESYFLEFDSGSRIELMSMPDLVSLKNSAQIIVGYAHIAISLGSKDEVNIMTNRLLEDGYTLVDGPRYTGDGYYESVFLDPDGNYIELVM